MRSAFHAAAEGFAYAVMSSLLTPSSSFGGLAEADIIALLNLCTHLFSQVLPAASMGGTCSSAVAMALVDSVFL